MPETNNYLSFKSWKLVSTGATGSVRASIANAGAAMLAYSDTEPTADVLGPRIGRLCERDEITFADVVPADKLWARAVTGVYPVANLKIATA